MIKSDSTTNAKHERLFRFPLIIGKSAIVVRNNTFNSSYNFGFIKLNTY